MVAAQTTTTSLEIHSFSLYGCLKTNKVHQVRKVGVQGMAGYVATFNTIAKAKAFIKAAEGQAN